jgi:hypothetical protein
MEQTTVILISVFSLLGVVYGWYSLIYKKDSKHLLFHLGFATVTILLGISFITHYPYNRYNFLHIMIHVWCGYLGFVLAYYFKSKKQTDFVSILFAVFFLYLTLLKFFTFKRGLYLSLPLNVCNMAVVFIIIRAVVKSKMVDNYAMTVGLLGTIMNFTMGAWHNDTFNTTTVFIPGTLGFYYVEVIEATLVHSFLLPFCIFTYLTKTIVPNVKEMAKNFLWIIPLFIVLVFTNQIYQGDFFFTGVYRDTPPLLISIYNAMPLVFNVELFGRVFEINILDNIVVVALSFAVMILVNFALTKLPKVKLH